MKYSSSEKIPVRLSTGWWHDWYAPQLEDRVTVREIVPGPFKSPRLVANTPFVLMSSTKTRDECGDLREERRCAKLRPGIPDPWAEYLSYRAVSMASRRLNADDRRSRSKQIDLTEVMWKDHDFCMSQGIPDPWKNFPRGESSKIKDIGGRQMMQNSMECTESQNIGNKETVTMFCSKKKNKKKDRSLNSKTKAQTKTEESIPYDSNQVTEVKPVPEPTIPRYTMKYTSETEPRVKELQTLVTSTCPCVPSQPTHTFPQSDVTCPRRPGHVENQAGISCSCPCGGFGRKIAPQVQVDHYKCQYKPTRTSTVQTYSRLCPCKLRRAENLVAIVPSKRRRRKSTIECPCLSRPLELPPEKPSRPEFICNCGKQSGTAKPLPVDCTEKSNHRRKTVLVECPYVSGPLEFPPEKPLRAECVCNCRSRKFKAKPVECADRQKLEPKTLPGNCPCVRRPTKIELRHEKPPRTECVCNCRSRKFKAKPVECTNRPKLEPKTLPGNCPCVCRPTKIELPHEKPPRTECVCNCRPQKVNVKPVECTDRPKLKLKTLPGNCPCVYRTTKIELPREMTPRTKCVCNCRPQKIHAKKVECPSYKCELPSNQISNSNPVQRLCTSNMRQSHEVPLAPIRPLREPEEHDARKSQQTKPAASPRQPQPTCQSPSDGNQGYVKCVKVKERTKSKRVARKISLNTIPESNAEACPSQSQCTCHGTISMNVSREPPDRGSPVYQYKLIVPDEISLQQGTYCDSCCSSKYGSKNSNNQRNLKETIPLDETRTNRSSSLIREEDSVTVVAKPVENNTKKHREEKRLELLRGPKEKTKNKKSWFGNKKKPSDQETIEPSESISVTTSKTEKVRSNDTNSTPQNTQEYEHEDCVCLQYTPVIVAVDSTQLTMPTWCEHCNCLALGDEKHDDKPCVSSSAQPSNCEQTKQDRYSEITTNFLTYNTLKISKSDELKNSPKNEDTVDIKTQAISSPFDNRLTRVARRRRRRRVDIRTEVSSEDSDVSTLSVVGVVTSPTFIRMIIDKARQEQEKSPRSTANKDYGNPRVGTLIIEDSSDEDRKVLTPRRRISFSNITAIDNKAAEMNKYRSKEDQRNRQSKRLEMSPKTSLPRLNEEENFDYADNKVDCLDENERVLRIDYMTDVNDPSRRKQDSFTQMSSSSLTLAGYRTNQKPSLPRQEMTSTPDDPKISTNLHIMRCDTPNTNRFLEKQDLHADEEESIIIDKMINKMLEETQSPRNSAIICDRNRMKSKDPESQRQAGKNRFYIDPIKLLDGSVSQEKSTLFKSLTDPDRSKSFIEAQSEVLEYLGMKPPPITEKETSGKNNSTQETIASDDTVEAFEAEVADLIQSIDKRLLVANHITTKRNHATNTTNIPDPEEEHKRNKSRRDVSGLIKYYSDLPLKSKSITTTDLTKLSKNQEKSKLCDSSLSSEENVAL